MLSVANPSIIKTEVSRILQAYRDANAGDLTGHIFNLGHGILPSAKLDNVSALIDTLHELSQR